MQSACYMTMERLDHGRRRYAPALDQKSEACAPSMSGGEGDPEPTLELKAAVFTKRS